MRRSAPKSCREWSNANINVMIRNILNSSVAATRFALKIAVNPSITLALYTQAMIKVPSKDDITTPLRKIIVKIIRSVKKPYNQWDIVNSTLPSSFLYRLCDSLCTARERVKKTRPRFSLSESGNTTSELLFRRNYRNETICKRIHKR